MPKGVHNSKRGPPRQVKTPTEAWRKKTEALVRKYAREKGKHIIEACLDMVYDSDIQDAVRVGAMKLLTSWIVVPESKQTIEEHKYEHAPVLLPVLDEDPGKLDFDAEPIHQGEKPH